MRAIKLIFILTILFLHQKAWGQNPENQISKFTEVIAVEGKTKKQLLDAAKLWIISTLKSGDNMVELDGSNSDQIIGTGNLLNGTIDVSSATFEPRNVVLNFKFSVFCKEGRYKYEVSNFTVQYTVWDGIKEVERVDTNLEELRIPSKYQTYMGKKKFARARIIMKEQIELSVTSLITNFKDSMTKENNDDW